MASILEPVYLGAPSDRRIGTLLTAALESSPQGLRDSLVLASRLGALVAGLDVRSTWDRWQALATVASDDLAAARAIEPHLDAVAILTEAGTSSATLWPTDSPTLWGVFASESGDDPVIATSDKGRTHLSGTKQWCSLASTLDAALVTARTSNNTRQLFAVDLRQNAATPIRGKWHARGLAEIESGPVRFTNIAAEPIGEPGWYLARPSFAWGGIGVAACWFGGAVGLARTIFDAARDSEADPFLLMHLGAVDALLESSRRSLTDAAQQIDSEPHERDAARILALRVRSTVAAACEEIIRRSGHALGPAPLALNEKHAKRIADLELYLRQHHAERDDAALGGALTRRGDYPW